MAVNKLILSYDEHLETWQNIFHFLESARNAGKEELFSRHLVGATLQLRFPNDQVNYESYSTVCSQLVKRWDFHIGDTVFHVNVAPVPSIFEKCNSNLKEGFRVYLIVPDRFLAGARLNNELLLGRRMAVESIESFVSQNIEEISLFSKKKLPDGLRKLIEEYNKRITETEVDKSLLIEIPRNL